MQAAAKNAQVSARMAWGALFGCVRLTDIIFSDVADPPGDSGEGAEKGPEAISPGPIWF
jgi:hypothetical protein